MSISPVSSFTGSVRICWITTYNIDIGLFDSFLLPRLGEPPLNAVVLADQHKVDEALLAVSAQEAWRLRRANRRWLLRPVDGGGAFHPKSILTVTRDRAELLVGSGNLSLNGYDRGHETFSAFSSTTPTGRAALRTWVDWMGRLIVGRADPVLAQRFDHLVEHMPQLIGDLTASPVLHNLDRSLFEQIADRLPAMTPVELHLAAPFHDRDAEAVKRLLRELRPRKVVIYVATGSQINGAALTSVLSDAGHTAVELRQFVDEDGVKVGFVHAKLVAATYTDGTGVVVGGSANLSVAALFGAHSGDAWANVELATVAETSADEAVATFHDERRLSSEPVPLGALSDWSAEYDDPPSTLPYRVIRATILEDGTVELRVTPPVDDDALLTDGQSTGPHGRVQPELPMVWLVSPDGEPMSNRCVLDMPAELAAQLGERAPSTDAPPSGLRPEDLDTPLGQLLLHVHHNVVMDVADTEAIGLADRATEGEIEGGADLWERLATERLQRDPRVSSYTSILNRAGTPTDDLYALLAAMLDQAPDDVRTLLGNVIPFPRTGTPTSDEEPATRSRWSVTARIRVRLRNVLKRWIAALADERLTWIDPSAPLANTTVLTDALILMTVWSKSHEDVDVGLDTDELLDFLRSLLVAATTALDAGSRPAPE